MADLTSASVTIEGSYREGDRTGKYTGTWVFGTMVLAGQGAGLVGSGTGIPALAFGLTSIDASQSLVDSTSGYIYPTAPTYDKTGLLVGGGASNAAQALTATVRFRIKGGDLTGPTNN